MKNVGTIFRIPMFSVVGCYTNYWNSQIGILQLVNYVVCTILVVCHHYSTVEGIL